MVRPRSVWLLVAMLALMCTPLLARQHIDGHVSPAVEAIPDPFQSRILPYDTLLTVRSVTVSDGTIDPELGLYRTTHRFHEAPAEGLSTLQASATVLAAESTRFGWAGDGSDLELVCIDSTAAARHVLFQQVVDGIPVYNRLVRLSFDASNQPLYLASDYIAVNRLTGRRPELDDRAAGEIASAAVSRAGARTKSRGMVFYPSNPPRIAWRMIAWPMDVPGEWEVLVDASTGEIIHLIETTLRHNAAWFTHNTSSHGAARKSSDDRTDGSGFVFDPDPLTTAGVLYGDSYTNNDNADSDELNAQRILATLRDITRGEDGLFRLEGPHLRVVGHNAANREVYSPPAEAHPDSFRYTRSEGFFEAVNVYYHIDASQRYIQSLGFSGIQNNPIEANPHGEGNRDQSHYYPHLNFLSFGTGHVNDAEDADVILHEYGHAMLEATSPGMAFSQQGMSIHEGWADYWAGSYRRNLVETHSVPEQNWRRLFRWDSGYTGVGPTPWTYWPGRSLDHQGRYPESLTGNRWTDGLLLATTLMEIYDEVGREKSDALNLQAQYFLTPGSGMPDYARALIKADRLLHQNAYTSVLIEILSDRGFIEREAYRPVLSHLPLTGMYEHGSPVRIEASATSMSSDIVAVQFHYRIAGTWQSPVPMTQENDTLFAVLWSPPEAPGNIAYYLTARDRAGSEAMLPEDAPEDVFTLNIGVDADPPEIGHSPVSRASIAGWPVEVDALVTDASGVDSVWIEYRLTRNSAEIQRGAVGLIPEDSFFYATLDIPSSILQAGDKVAYRIFARDLADPANTGAMPEASDSVFVIRIDDSGLLRYFSFEGPARGIVGTGQWQRGAPAFAIHAPYRGSAAFGTRLTDPYEADASISSLSIPPVDLSEHSPAHLVFYHWYNTSANTNEAADGGNVRISTDGGSQWILAEPLEGYPTTISNSLQNPLAGQPAFGGSSSNWRRAVIPLPSVADVHIRFDFGTGASAAADDEARAGWYIDEVTVVSTVDAELDPPVFQEFPEPLVVADAGAVPPPVSLRVDSEPGVDRVSGRFELVDRDGAVISADTLTFAMDPADPRRYHTSFSVDEGALVAGSRIEYRLTARGFDGAFSRAPGEGEPPFAIEYRRRDRHDLLSQAVRTGFWSAAGGYWHIGERVREPSVSSLIPTPIDLPENMAEADLRIDHRFDMNGGVGGNVKISTDGGASWRVLQPVGGYPTIISDGGSEEPVFGGTFAAGTAKSFFDLMPYAGNQVRLRVDFRATRPLRTEEFWQVHTAEAAYSTLDDEFETHRQTSLHANFPNPFRNVTTFTFTLANAGGVRVGVYDVMGREIATLLNEERMEGTHSLTFDGTNLATGLYLVRLQADGKTHVRKISIIR